MIEKIDLSQVQLQRPSENLKQAYLNSYLSLKLKEDQFPWIYFGESADLEDPKKNFGEYVEKLLAREKNPPPGFVPDTTWWAIYKQQMVGRISFRHTLNDFLKLVGGHIGYIVHPNWRRQGIATWMLSEVLKKEIVKKSQRVLLTCDAGNFASEKTIINNGGVFERTVNVGPDRPEKKHYWINV